MTVFSERYGPWAIVCGASEGLGAAFSLELARRGVDVVLVARRPEVLETMRRTIAEQTGREALCVTADLSSREAIEVIAKATESLSIGLVIYNAAASTVGPFLEQQVDDLLRTVDVNVRGPIAVCHHFGKRLAAQRRGGLIVLSSITAFQGSPFVTTYGATKSFNLTFGEGLWFELREHGVDVLSVCAGATRTPALLKAAPDGAPGMLEPEAVAFEGLNALGRGPSMIPGWFNRIVSFIMRRLLPRRLTVSIMGNETRKLQRMKGHL